MTSYIIYLKNKINVILPVSSIAAIVVTSESQPWTSRLFRAGAAAGFEENDFYIVIIRSFLGGCSTYLLAASFCCQYIGVLVGAFWSLILIYRHRVKSVCKSLNSHGELSLC